MSNFVAVSYTHLDVYKRQVLNGVIMFFSDFLKHYPGNCEIAFIQMSSYMGGLTSTGIVYKKMELTKEVEGRHIILMEDIVDTGNTIESLFESVSYTHLDVYKRQKYTFLSFLGECE